MYFAILLRFVSIRNKSIYQDSVNLRHCTGEEFAVNCCHQRETILRKLTYPKTVFLMMFPQTPSWMGKGYPFQYSPPPSSRLGAQGRLVLLNYRYF